MLSSKATLLLNLFCIALLGALLFFQHREGVVLDISPMDLVGKK